MKYLPAAVSIICAALLASCGRKAAEVDQEAQERLAEEKQAQAESALHEQQAALDERDRLLTEREQQLNVAPAPAASAPAPAMPEAQPPPVAQGPAVSTDATFQTFYDALSPYGTWVQMPGYGYVWQPQATVENGGWRPYTLGHWAYTDAGWMWMSDEPFGWITYHYGRWMRTRSLNWVWTPGDQWAPAWVSWRYGNGFAGWAPLPPQARFDGAAGIQQWADQQYDLGAADYTFVPASDFGDESMAADAVPPDQEEPVYADSDNVTNLYYDSGYGGIVCYGPTYDFMRFKSRRGLPPQLKLSRGGFNTRGSNGAIVSGNILRVSSPRIIAARSPVAPRTSRGRVADVRLIAPLGSPAAHRAALAPIYRAAQPSSAPAQEQATRALQAPPAPRPETGAAESAPLVNGAPPEAPRPPAQAMNAEAQSAHDQEVIRQQQAAEQERAARDAESAAEEQRAAQRRAAAEQAAGQRAAQEEAARAAREQAAAARQESMRQAQPSGAPGTQGSGGKNQQQ